jgi:hypothetical protein
MFNQGANQQNTNMFNQNTQNTQQQQNPLFGQNTQQQNNMFNQGNQQGNFFNQNTQQTNLFPQQQQPLVGAGNPQNPIFPAQMAYFNLMNFTPEQQQLVRGLTNDQIRKFIDHCLKSLIEPKKL